MHRSKSVGAPLFDRRLAGVTFCELPTGRAEVPFAPAAILPSAGKHSGRRASK
jgi:hypothetical protein